MKTRRILAIALLLLTLASCNSDKRQVLQAAQGYLDATANYRIYEAYQYASKETRETTLPYITNTILPATDSAFLANNVPASIEIDSLLINSDTAWVAYTKTTPIKTLSNIICLIKEDNRWVVDVPLAIPSSIQMAPNGATQVTYGSDTDTTMMLPLTKAVAASRKSDTTAK